jgi:hypothetical protein
MTKLLKLLDPRGNLKAQPRLIAILLLLVVAAVLVSLTDAKWAVVVGSFVGAALSLAANWIVTTLEEKPGHKTPEALLNTVHNDLESAGYYRTDQVIKISVVRRRRNDNMIRLHFKAKINPIQDKAKVKHPRIRAPKGAELVDEPIYRVNKAIVESGGDEEISTTSFDELIVQYVVKDDAAFPIRDDHHWPSPVLDYKVLFEDSNQFSFAVGAIIPAGEKLPLNSGPSQEEGFTEYWGKGPALTSQGFRWEIKWMGQVQDR